MTDAPPDLPDAPDASAIPGRRRWPWLVLAALVVAGGAVAAVALLGGDDEPRPTPSDVTTALPDPLGEANDPDTAELGELLALGQTSTYHATYTTTGATDQVPAPAALEVWRDGDRLRQDTATEVEGTAVHTASFVTGDVVVLCSRTGDAEWSCAESEAAGTEQAGIIGSVRAQLEGDDVTPRDDELDGRPVRCFAFSGPDGEGDVCVTLEGVPAKIEFQGVGILLASLDRDVPGSTFDPPAEPAQPAEG